MGYIDSNSARISASHEDAASPTLTGTESDAAVAAAASFDLWLLTNLVETSLAKHSCIGRVQGARWWEQGMMTVWAGGFHHKFLVHMAHTSGALSANVLPWHS
eukprot:2194485-Prymnesium_polylepis.1